MGTRELLGRSLKVVSREEKLGGEGAGFAGGRKKEEKFERLVSKFREISNIPTWFSLKKSELSNKLKLYTIIVYLDLARP